MKGNFPVNPNDLRFCFLLLRRQFVNDCDGCKCVGAVVFIKFPVCYIMNLTMLCKAKDSVVTFLLAEVGVFVFDWTGSLRP